jgi:hypothetical protein
MLLWECHRTRSVDLFICDCVCGSIILDSDMFFVNILLDWYLFCEHSDYAVIDVILCVKTLW